jgi:hypothetical protein
VEHGVLTYLNIPGPPGHTTVEVRRLAVALILESCEIDDPGGVRTSGFKKQLRRDP